MIEGLHEAIPRGEQTNFKVAEHGLIRLWIVNIHWGVKTRCMCKAQIFAGKICL